MNHARKRPAHREVSGALWCAGSVLGGDLGKGLCGGELERDGCGDQGLDGDCPCDVRRTAVEAAAAASICPTEHCF